MAGGKLQHYSFIEPRYFPNQLAKLMPNDQHPPHVVTLGEQLIAQVYNTLRAQEGLWKKTLLIVIWDEHGGCFDHVQPPAAQPPDDGRVHDAFGWNRFGVRIPALLISPWIPAGTILRPPGETPFDHTSVMATARKCLGINAKPLTGRDAAAPDLTGALKLGPGDLNLGPTSIPVPVYTPTPDEVTAAAQQPLNGMQHSLLYAAAAMPPGEHLLAAAEALRSGVTLHDLLRGTLTPGNALPHRTPAEALPDLQNQLAAVLGRDLRETG
ncbi:MAG TPA: alkaline phosphatase family protein [Thermoanaerobaculia bacterium]|nr:alkaline phosphatase family protein [Thermoanaerobaculia bacterium]